MKRAMILALACLLFVTVAVAPAAVAKPDPPGSGQVCVPGLTLCCGFYDDGDITPMIYCL